MEDLTTWKINGLELSLDIDDADNVEKYEAAMEQLEADFPKDKSEGAAAYIRAYCKAFRTLYDSLFGDGTAARIFADVPDNVRKYTAVYGDFWRLSQNRRRSLRRRWCRFAANICRKAENGESAL